MKTSTLAGLATGLVAILVAFVFEGGELLSLLNPGSALLVFGGTLGATMVAFPLDRFLSMPKALARTLTEPVEDLHKLIATFVSLSERARRQGLLSLEDDAQAMQNPYFRKGLLLVVDGIDTEVVRDALEIEMMATHERHERSYSVLETMGGFAPTMGIIGTVMGLIHVLGNLEDPSTLGPAIAAAFVATLYGVGSANLLWLPLAGKLKVASGEERFQCEMIMTGLLSIQAGDNPRITREKLEAFLAAGQRNQPQSDKAAAGAAPAAGGVPTPPMGAGSPDPARNTEALRR